MCDVMDFLYIIEFFFWKIYNDVFYEVIVSMIER